VDQIRSLSWIIEKPTIDNLHKLRVCFKQLRYTIEFFFNMLEGDAIKAISIFKAIQDHLGRINDLAVLFNYVQKVGMISEIESTRGPFQPLSDELSSLIAAFPGVWQEYHERPIINVLGISQNFG
jgi:CHAD domain-containing protein